MKKKIIVHVGIDHNEQIIGSICNSKKYPEYSTLLLSRANCKKCLKKLNKKIK